MIIENQTFNTAEEPEDSIESEATVMSPEDVEERLQEADEYIEGLRVLVKEKEAELLTLKEAPDVNGEKIERLEAEIQELQEEISGLEEFSEEGKEVLEGGGEFFDRKID